jgi:predicted ribosomally synthesized peptide with SipW-like signal peptide
MTGIFNARILASIAMLVFVGAAVASSTGAFFSDVETSTGNTFTAGDIDLQVDSEQHYNGRECVGGVWTGPGTFPSGECEGTWAQTNLGPEHQFFNFADVKPGDQGENTISLHVTSNDAWLCADVSLQSNDDVSTVDPETDAGDAVENGADSFDGELAQNLNFTAWLDNDATVGVPGDNVWQGQALEPLYFAPGPAFNVLGGTTTLAIAESGDTPVVGGSTTYVGLAWCAGTMSTNGGANLSCDGASMGNVAQTDSMVGTISFRAEQSRNNPNFLCTPTPQT